MQTDTLVPLTIIHYLPSEWVLLFCAPNSAYLYTVLHRSCPDSTNCGLMVQKEKKKAKEWEAKPMKL